MGNYIYYINNSSSLTFLFKYIFELCVFHYKSIWLYTERARSFPSQIFLKNLPQFWDFHEDI